MGCMKLLTIVSGIHKLPSYLLLNFMFQATGEGLLVVFNPISGTTIGERGGIIPLGYQLSQALLMHHPDEHYLKVCTVL